MNIVAYAKLSAASLALSLAAGSACFADQPKAKFGSPPGRVILQVAFSPDGKTLAAGGEKWTYLFDTSTGRVKGVLKTGLGTVLSMSWSPDSKLIAVTGREKLEAWSVATERIQRKIGTEISACCLAISPDGSKIISACYRAPLIWDFNSGNQLGKLEPLLPLNAELDFDAEINAVAWSPDGKQVAAATEGMGVKVWDVASGKNAFQLFRYRTPIKVIAYSPDGKTLAAGLDFGTISLWDLSSKKEIRSINADERLVNGIAFTPDGKRFVSAGSKGNIKVWDLGTGKELYNYVLPKGYPHSLALSPDGKTIAVSGWSGIELLSLENAAMAPKVLTRPEQSVHTKQRR